MGDYVVADLGSLEPCDLTLAPLVERFSFFFPCLFH